MNELTIYERADVKASNIFNGGAQTLVNKIKEEVLSVVIDATTSKGRKEAVSLAAKVRKSKTFLDGLGKDLTEEARQKVNAVNAERKMVREELDELAEQVRRPVTDWENKEKERVAVIRAVIDYMETPIDVEATLEELYSISDAIEETETTEEIFHEFLPEAIDKKKIALEKISARISALEKIQEQEVELRKLREAEAEREEKDRLARETKEREKREKRIALEAEEKAKKEAKEAIERAEKEKVLAEERERLAKEKAEADKAEAAKKAEREKLEAVEAEKRRFEHTAAIKKEADDKRKANEAHRNKIRTEAIESAINAGIKQESAETLISLIESGKIKNVELLF